MKKIIFFILPLLFFLQFNIVSSAFNAPNGKDYKYMYTAKWKNDSNFEYVIHAFANVPLAFSEEVNNIVCLDDGVMKIASGSIDCCSSTDVEKANLHQFANDMSHYTFPYYPYTTWQKTYQLYDYDMQRFSTNAMAVDYLAEQNKSYDAELGGLLGVLDNLSVTLEKYDYPIRTERTVEFGWQFKSSTGLSLISNDYTNLSIEITPYINRVYFDKNNIKISQVRDNGTTVLVKPSALKYSYNFRSMYDALPSNIPDGMKYYTVSCGFDIRLVDKALGYTLYGDASNLLVDIDNSEVYATCTYSIFQGSQTKKVKIKLYDFIEYPDDPDNPIYPDAPWDPSIPDIPTDDLVKGIQSLLAYVSVVPLALATLLSFLPTWVTTLISTSVSLSVVLLIYKLIRG